MRGSVISSKFSACQARSKPPGSPGAGICFQRVRRSFKLKMWSYTSFPNTSSQSRLGGVAGAAMSNRREGEAGPQAAIAAPANGAPTPTAAADFRNDLRVNGRRKAPAGGLWGSAVIELARPGIEDDAYPDEEVRRAWRSTRRKPGRSPTVPPARRTAETATGSQVFTVGPLSTG